MKKTVFVLMIANVLASSAFADMAVDCYRNKSRPHRGVYLHDVSDGFSIEDKGNPIIGVQEPVQPTKQTNDSLEFSLDNGTSIRTIYSYQGLALCEDEGTSEEVVLEIFEQMIGQNPELSETLSCSCAWD